MLRRPLKKAKNRKANSKSSFVLVLGFVLKEVPILLSRMHKGFDSPFPNSGDQFGAFFFFRYLYNGYLFY